MSDIQVMHMHNRPAYLSHAVGDFLFGEAVAILLLTKVVEKRSFLHVLHH